jgi:hypothetical protein
MSREDYPSRIERAKPKERPIDAERATSLERTNVNERPPDLQRSGGFLLSLIG